MSSLNKSPRTPPASGYQSPSTRTPTKSPKVPPSSLSEETFKYQFPFIDIDFMTLREEAESKFTQIIDVDSAALAYLVMYLHGYMNDSRIIFNSGNVGQGVSDSIYYHYSQMARLAKLSNALVVLKKRKRDQNRKRKERGDEIEEKGKSKETADEKEDLAGIVFRDAVEEEDPNVDSQTSTEGAFVDEERLCGAGKADIVVQSYKKIFVKKDLDFWNTLDMVSLAIQKRALRTIAVIEYKDKAERNAVYQPAYYALQEGIKNFKEGRSKPIYFILWGLGSWAFGTVTVEGLLTLKNRVIHGDSVVDSNRRSMLIARLNEVEKEAPQYQYEDGEYPFGRLCINNTVLNLSREEVLGKDTIRFYQSLLRLFLGNSLSRLTVNDVEEMKKIIIEQEEKLFERKKVSQLISMIDGYKEKNRYYKTLAYDFDI